MISSARPSAEPVWKPRASWEVLRLRAKLLAKIRAFFAARSVLEVETPVLSRAGSTDLQLLSLSTRMQMPGATASQVLYLQTSPEFAMKRLLASGSGPIYQIARAFRDGESGRLHNPEFTLVEWYQPNQDHHALMGEVEALVSDLIGLGPCERMSYSEAFVTYAGFEPHREEPSKLALHAQRLGLQLAGGGIHDPNIYLDLILSHAVAPRIGKGRPCFIYDYPISQAALARIRDDDPPVVERFELFVDGIELASGYHELADPIEQRERFRADLDRRRRSGASGMPIDERLLNALAHGLPPCAGCALGFDRLVMLAAGVQDIQDVLAFPVTVA
ncbi:MAG: EF-P lysine aminoacylase EpmA [Gammaproteobacteria bacterium]